MPRAKKPVEVQTESEAQEIANTALEKAEENTEPVEYVTQEAHDNAVKHLQNEISDLKEQIADLTVVVTSPSGSVSWHEVGVMSDAGVASPHDPPDDIPAYTPAYQTGDDNTPWYQG